MPVADHIKAAGYRSAERDGCAAVWRAEVVSSLQGEVLIDHEGAVDKDCLHRLRKTAEAASREAADRVVVRKRLFSVLDEGLENIHHHGLPDAVHLSFVRLVRQDDRYLLVLGNAMPPATAALLGRRVELLNEMDDDGLKEQYLKLLSLQERTANGGAGLGLITMARKSDGPIRSHHHPMADGLICFAMELEVLRG